MTTRIAVIADLHFGTACPLPARRSEIADVLLLRAVHRLNRFIRPDVTLLLGDLVDDGNSPRAGERFTHLNRIVRRIDSPVIALPGNHDGGADRFRRLFGTASPWVDIHGVRFVPFVDREEPRCNASRIDADLERMRQARAGYEGAIVALQHTSLFPPGLHDCPYNYTNAEAVIAAMRGAGVRLSISGHCHEGFDLESNGMRFIAAPALCEAPFAFLEIVIEGECIRAVRHELQLPRKLGLVDHHLHTQLAYCGKGMDIAKAPRLAEDFGLEGIAFAEHSGQLYFNNDDYWAGRYFERGMETAAPFDNRMNRYREAVAAVRCPNVRIGLEVDCDGRGQPLLNPEDRDRVEFLLGAIHVLPEVGSPHANVQDLCDSFLALQSRFVKSGIAILAHPFRVFQRAKRPVPEQLFQPTVHMLKDAGVAAEMNFHTNAPEPGFFKLCLEAGVKIAFGSDAHESWEIGEFEPHLQLLRTIGFNGELGDILTNPFNPSSATRRPNPRRRTAHDHSKNHRARARAART